MKRTSKVLYKVNGKWTIIEKQVIQIELVDGKLWGRIRHEGKMKRVTQDFQTGYWIAPARATFEFSSGRTVAKEFANS